LDEEVGIDAIIIAFSKAFDLVLHDRLLTKLAASGVDSRVAVWVREFLVGRIQRGRVGGQLSKGVKLTSVVSESNVLGPLLFPVYLNYIWRNIDSSITPFVDDCITYRKHTNKKDIERLQKNMDILGMGSRKWYKNIYQYKEGNKNYETSG
jgi:hypothetical protein